MATLGTEVEAAAFEVATPAEFGNKYVPDPLLPDNLCVNRTLVVVGTLAAGAMGDIGDEIELRCPVRLPLPEESELRGVACTDGPDGDEQLRLELRPLDNGSHAPPISMRVIEPSELRMKSNFDERRE